MSTAFEAAFDEAVTACGGLTALAVKLGESTQTVSNWRWRGAVPANRCVLVERITRVSRIRLRPADAAEFWPELMNVEDPPAGPMQEARDAA